MHQELRLDRWVNGWMDGWTDKCKVNSTLCSWVRFLKKNNKKREFGQPGAHSDEWTAVAREHTDDWS